MVGPADADAFNAFEAEGWARRASGYHDFFAPITTRAIEPLLDAAAVGSETELLDVASGPGYVAAAAARRGAAATGIDVAAEMVELAASLNVGPSFVVGDAEELPFEDEAFDAVVASFAILHVGHPERVAAEIARVLRPGGRAALSVWDLPSRSRLMGVFVDAVARAGSSPPDGVPEGPDFFRFADDAEMQGLLAGAGLVEPAVEALEFTHPISSPDELWRGMIDGTVRMRALIEGQAAEAKRRIREQFDQLVAEHESGGRLEIPVRIKLGAARKPSP